MPNHITTKIHLKTPIEDFLKATSSDESILDFNRIVPMPESLHIESSTLSDQAFLYAYTNGYTKKMTYDDADKLKKVIFIGYVNQLAYLNADIERSKQTYNRVCDDDAKSSEFKSLAKQTMENFEKYGYINWYEWSIEHWGTKWNAYDCVANHDENTIKFDTAWNYPSRLIDRLFFENKFSGVIDSVCESWEKWHRLEYVNGVLVKCISDDESLKREIIMNVFDYTEEKMTQIEQELEDEE